MEGKNSAKSWLFAAALLLSSLVWTWASYQTNTSTPMSPAMAAARPGNTPDINQRQSVFPDHGNSWCGPTSVAGGLSWLDANGFPGLAAGLDPIALTQAIGSTGYLNTQDELGTGINDLLRGLTSWSRVRGYRVKTLSSRGWRAAQSSLFIGERGGPLRLNWLGEALRRPTGVWLNIGWYDHDPEEKTYSRIGGHWVTAVGFEGTPDNMTAILIRDPAPRSERYFDGPYTETVDLFPLERGTLTGDRNGLPRPTDGLYALSGELQINKRKGADTAILDAAVVYELVEK